MTKKSTWTLAVLMACGLALSSCGKKGNLERPPQKDKEEVSAISLENNPPLVI